jgi:hypothetical protein
MRRATREDIMADLSDPNFWIAVGAVGTGVTAVAAGVSALFSWLSSRDAANAAQATLYRSFQKEYASPQMHDALDRLSEFCRRCKRQNLDVASEWKRLWESGPETEQHAEAQALDAARRRVSHFFGAIADLYNGGLLKKQVASRLANFSGDLVFLVGEHLEKARNPNYLRAHFDILASLTGYPGPRA